MDKSAKTQGHIRKHSFQNLPTPTSPSFSPEGKRKQTLETRLRLHNFSPLPANLALAK